MLVDCHYHDFSHNVAVMIMLRMNWSFEESPLSVQCICEKLKIECFNAKAN